VAQYFAQMNALPASAFEFTSAQGKHYGAIQTGAWSPGGSTLTNTQDGFLDAVNYFVVPSSVRSGTVTIHPSLTVGYYYDFNASNQLALKTGGPITIPVQFPTKLTVTGGGVKPTSSPGSSSSGSWWVQLLVVAVAVAVAAQIIRRHPSARSSAELPPSEAMSEMHRRDVLPPPPAPPESPTSVEDAVAPVEVVPESVESALPSDPDEEHGARDGALLTVSVLGALRFDPPVRGISEPARALLCYLAFHRDRPLSAGEIQTALWPTSSTSRDIAPGTFRNYVTEARRAVGSEILPEAVRGAGYRVQGVVTDVEIFHSLERQSREGDDAASLELRLQALALVREYPFATETSSFFEWVRSEALEGQVVRAVSDLAYRTGLDCIRVSDFENAEVALRVGLLAAPASLPIWQQLTDVVAMRGDRSLLKQHFAQAGTFLSSSEVADLQRRVEE
jgi:DNA-binding SARP family transcriptional activator